MAELRALVAVKRVIDFAVKVTFPTPTLPQHLETAAVSFQDQERTLPGILLKFYSPLTQSVIPGAKIKGCEFRTIISFWSHDPASLFLSPLITVGWRVLVPI